jgi:hypothetical protein
VIERPAVQISSRLFSAPQTGTLRAPKTARPNLVRLHVSGDICPNLLPRLLGLVAQFDEIPYSIALPLHWASLKLSIDLGRPEDSRAETQLNKVAGIPTARGVRLVAVRRD